MSPNAYAALTAIRRASRCRTQQTSPQCALAALQRERQPHSAPSGQRADRLVYSIDAARVLMSLPAVDRDLVLIIGIDGHSPSTAAEACGLSPRSAQRRYAAALDRLAARLIALDLL